jgi:hypothetical protein
MAKKKVANQIICVVALLAWLVSVYTWGQLWYGNRSSAPTNNYSVMVLTVAFLLLMSMGVTKKLGMAKHVCSLILVLLLATVAIMATLMYNKSLNMDQRMMLMKAHLGAQFVALVLFGLSLNRLYKRCMK